MHYVKIGNNVLLFSEDAIGFSDKLEPLTYILKQNPVSKEYFLETSTPYNITQKVYGDVEFRTQRILRSFEEKKDSMGVLLVGTKGSGKTLLSKYLSMKANMPTLIINTKHTGEDFLSFINSINTPSVIIFDEFDKVYKKYNNEQRDLLTILDGVYTSKHLFMFTANDIHEIDSLLLNRPGRVYYKFEYVGLEEDFIREYCDDNLKNKKEIESVVTLSNAFNDFNFDMLQALVEEMNRYDEPAEQAVNYLNISPNGEMATYDITVFNPDGTKNTDIWPNSLENHDVMNSKRRSTVEVNQSKDEECVTLFLDHVNITDWTPDFGMFTYHVENYKIVLKKRQTFKRSFGPWK